MKNVFEIRTDLALEVNEQVNREKGRLKGVIINEMKDNKTGIKVTVLEITGKEGVKALHRPEGKYITIEAGKLGTTDDEYSQRTAVILAKNLEELLSGYIREKEKATVLVLGLGNADVTADALGPDVVKNILWKVHSIWVFSVNVRTSMSFSISNRNMPPLSPA